MSIVVLLATALAAGVEWVEALTIVLAVGLLKGWRSALVGMAIGFVALALLVAVFGITITSKVSIDAARTVVGVFLLLFGLKWLHKAILRSSGLKSLSDEAVKFEETKQKLGQSAGTSGLDRAGVTTALSGVFLEGLEVVFIVVALGGLQDIPSAVIGALVALVIVGGAGAAFRRPLTRVPENAIKYVVGIMLTSFGTFFSGEGIGVHWWGDDLSLLILIAAYGLASLAFVWLLKRPARQPSSISGVERTIKAIALELWGLFVDDGAIALVAVVVLLAVALLVQHQGDSHNVAGILLIAGVLLAVWVGLSNAAKPAPKAAPATAPEPDPASQLSASDESRVGPETRDPALIGPRSDR
jgi:Ca2+/H+ antiporter, TMEM165/GDT1 family